MTPGQPIELIPFADDPLARLASRLLEEHHDSLPRLERVIVLLADNNSAVRLRRLLLQQAAELGFDALLGPRITTLDAWLNENVSLHGHEIVSDQQRTLLLVEALREHRSLFGEGNLWALAEALLQLFDELTLNQVTLPSELSQFTSRIASGYGLQGCQPAALDREARLVHTLWHALHQQLHARGQIDRNTRYLLQLAQSLQHPPRHPLYMVSAIGLHKAEQQWLQQMFKGGHITLMLHGEAGQAPLRRYHPATPLLTILTVLQQAPTTEESGCAVNRLLAEIYHPDDEAVPLRERAGRFAEQHPVSPIADTLRLLHTDGDEQEARAVDLQVRRWLLAGQRSIGIITENRRLARRVRALLERAGVMLHDTSGWALSTTRAAATLEQWLQCVEEDFNHLPMLDLLKSPFIFTSADREAHLGDVYRLEQDIVLHENIGGGLNRYLRQSQFRQHRLPQELAERLNGVIRLLQHLDEAARPLGALLEGEHPPSDYFDTLLLSLIPLDLLEGLASDAAGAQLLEVLQQVQQGVRGSQTPISWMEFRGWLGRILEQSHFRPASQGHGVNLMGLGQSQLQRFDALIIAGMEREYLPGPPAGSPFFNDGVRHELGLPDSEEAQALRLFHFRRLLESAPRLLLTLRQQQDGEEILPSPWLQQLCSFHRLAYGSDLEDRELSQLIASDTTQVVERHATLPAAEPLPAPSLPTALLPQRYSASAYQQLMNCPYQFYAARGLGLAPPEAIREALEKSDYGERVHRILQAFHGGIPGLPGPFARQLDRQTFAQARNLLETISREVFAEDMEDNFLHRGWLQRWLERVPDYLEWQLQREQLAKVSETESQLQSKGFAPNLELHGRLDRIDKLSQGVAIIDYKTGTIPSEEEVLSGEAVQLPFYSLLASQQATVSQVEYLTLDDKRLGSRVVLQGEQLAELSDEIGRRLRQLQDEMTMARGLPAWGDIRVCGHCRMEGLCRRSTWPAEQSETP